MRGRRAKKHVPYVSKNRIIIPLLLLCAVIIAAMAVVFTAKKDEQELLKYELLDDGTYCVVGVTSRDAESIEIPESYRGAGVSAIGESAFAGCLKLSSVKIPDSIKIIEDYAFSACASLEKIDLSAAQSIGFAIFESCLSLREISLPFIEFNLGYLFGEKDLLSNESVPDSLKEIRVIGGEISERAFYSCKTIEKITLGDAVTKISDEAFKNCEKIRSIAIPEGVASLGNDVFSDCTSLVEAELPKTLAEIGDRCFYSCESIRDIVLPDNVERVGNSAFEGCSELVNLSFSSNLSAIGNNAFSDCRKLSAIKLSDSLKTMGDGAFKNCSSLKEIIIPEGIKSIGFGAFEGCLALDSIAVPFVGRDGGAENSHFGYIFGGKVPETLASVAVSRAEILYGAAFLGCNKIKTVDLPDGMNIIYAGAFSGCESLERICLPKELLSVADELFLGCSSLKEIVLGDKVTKIGKSAFAGCCALESFEGSSVLEKISEGAFENCTSLCAVTVPSGVTQIGRGAFKSCVKLETLNYNATRIEGIDAFDFIFEGAGASGNGIVVNIGSNVEIIPAHLFSSPGANLAPKLRSVSFTAASLVREIGAYAFAYTPLPYISIPRSVSVIGEYAFRYCNSLVIDCEAGSKPVGWSKYWNASNCQTNWSEDAAVTYSFNTGGAGEIQSISSSDLIELPELMREGFVFLGWSESEDLSGIIYRGEYKRNYDITLYAVWQSEACDGSSFDFALYLMAEEEYTLTVSPGQTVYFKFVPNASGVYTFKSLGGLDTYGILYDETKNEIRSHDGEEDFLIDVLLAAGKTYYLAVKLYSPEESGTFVITVE